MVAVAATGAGMALPLLGAGVAHAASGATWDAVARCESGGQWSSDTGNGFFGGLEISQDTWDEYGGRRYAARPDLASITQQMEVANAILAALGPDAWPGCGDKAGLRQGDSASPTPPGPSLGDPLNPTRSGSNASGPVAVQPEAPATSGSSAPASASSSTSTSSSASSAPSGAPSAAASTAPVPPSSSGDGSGAAAASSSAADSSAADSSAAGGSLTGGGSPTGGGPAVAGSEPVAESVWGVLTPDPRSGRVSSRASERAVTYRVRPGDSLCAIAEAHGLSWRDLYHENKAKIGDDPNLIHPGQYLTFGH